MACAVYTVYLDEVLAGNLLMNTAILWLTARFCLLPCVWWRLAVSALLGAVYAILLFFPIPGYLVGVPAKAVLSVAMVVTAFAPMPPKRFATALAVFYLASFGLGGLVFGLSYFLGGSGFTSYGFLELPRGYFWPIIAAGLLAAWLVGRSGSAYLRRQFVKSLFHVPVRITLFGRHLAVDALVDTGNQLSDPLTNSPVLVVELDAVRELLPADIRQALEAENPDFRSIVSGMGDRRWATRLRIIPFQSLGRSNGLLLGFRPDEVELTYGREVVKVADVVVAVYQRRLCPESSYRALVNPRLLETAAGFS